METLPLCACARGSLLGVGCLLLGKRPVEGCCCCCVGIDGAEFFFSAVTAAAGLVDICACCLIGALSDTYPLFVEVAAAIPLLNLFLSSLEGGRLSKMGLEGLSLLLRLF